jgi:arylsulfatase A-like enzyme
MRRLAALLALDVAAGLACTGASCRSAGDRVPDNVVLIVVDTLRADHLGTYGYERDTSPFLDDLAARGVVFENAVSAAPATFPAVNTLLTSASPHVFYDNNAHDLGIPAEMTTLAEVFHAAGFRTGAVSASPIVRRSPSRLNRRGGFHQGFERFDERCSNARKAPPFSAGCVTRQALRMLRTFGRDRFFLYVHYLDPHAPYRPPPTFPRFGSAYEDKPFVGLGEIGPITGWRYGGGPDPHLTARDVQHLRDLYDAEILAVDHNLRRLLHGVRQRGRFDDTLFVIVADHGESFMEHGHFAHAKNVYQPVLHVPLIFYWSQRWQGGARRTDLACGVDVMPTILALAGIPAPSGMQGRPLLGRRPERRHGPRSCYSEGRAGGRALQQQVSSLRRGSTKIIYFPKAPHEVYDLAADPGESNDLAASDSAQGDERVRRMVAAAHDWQIKLGARPAGTPSLTLDPDAEQALRALGYLD